MAAAVPMMAMPPAMARSPPPRLLRRLGRCGPRVVVVRRGRRLHRPPRPRRLRPRLRRGLIRCLRPAGPGRDPSWYPQPPAGPSRPKTTSWPACRPPLPIMGTQGTTRRRVGPGHGNRHRPGRVLGRLCRHHFGVLVVPERQLVDDDDAMFGPGRFVDAPAAPGPRISSETKSDPRGGAGPWSTRSKLPRRRRSRSSTSRNPSTISRSFPVWITRRRWCLQRNPQPAPPPNAAPPNAAPPPGGKPNPAEPSGIDPDLKKDSLDKAVR